MNDPRNHQSVKSPTPVSFQDDEAERVSGTKVMGALPTGRPSLGPSAAGVSRVSNPLNREPTWSEKTWSDEEVQGMIQEWRTSREQERAQHAEEIARLKLEVAKLLTLGRLHAASTEEACLWLHHLYGNDVATLQAIETLRVRATKVFELRGGSHPALTLLATIDRLSPAELDEMARNILPESLKEAILQLRSRSSP